jgi:hypothetical protein
VVTRSGLMLAPGKRPPVAETNLLMDKGLYIFLFFKKIASAL